MDIPTWIIVAGAAYLAFVVIGFGYAIGSFFEWRWLDRVATPIEYLIAYVGAAVAVLGVAALGGAHIALLLWLGAPAWWIVGAGAVGVLVLAYATWAILTERVEFYG